MNHIDSCSSDRRPSRLAHWATALLLLAIGSSASAQCVSLTTLGSASTQSFDTLSNTAGSTTNNLTITGWFMTETGGGARDNEQYAVDTGASNTGDTFSYGAAAATDRALGSLQSGTLIASFGACFTNNTGATLASLDVAYTGEQWRIANTAAARDDRLDYQYSLDATSLTTGAWVDVNALDFVNPIKTAGVAGALDGNAAANRTAISQSIGGLSIANGATFWIRWNDLNASGADDGLAIENVSLTPQGGLPTTTLNISDVTLAEGDPPGSTTFTFAVTLSAPAGAGGVTFDIATADGTAQDDTPATEDNDYVAQSLTGQTIPAGSTGPYNFAVTVNRDVAVEANETFFVNVTNVTGGNVGDGQGQGTINNDDVTITPIHDVQGPGASSPIVGSSVTVRAIVTGVRSNGFFVQEEDAEVDADPATSEGILVFTAAAPPAAAVPGALVQVTGTVVEFVPAQDALQPPLTELSSPTVVQLSVGNPLPAAVPLTATFPDPAGPHDQLERLEGMRVSIASLTVGAPTGGSLSEPNATSASNGVFQGTITGVPRAFREPGIQAPDPAPSGTIPPIPRFDTNPEVLRVDSDSLVGQPALDVGTGATVSPLIGPLDYTFRRYTVLPDGSASPVVVAGATPTPVTAPVASEVTIGSYNLQRFYNDVDDPGITEPVLTAAAFGNRLAKASLGIRDFLRTPDILGVVEVENLAALQSLATRINADAVAAAQPDPQYQAFLVEGNDVGGIDVGFLVKTAAVVGVTPRVAVTSVTQVNAAETFVDPSTGAPATLNDRPPLVLEAVVNSAGRPPYPVTVIVNHLRSLNGINDESADGLTTVGNRIRVKRQAQANSLANLVQARQTTNPAERIVLVGDFNAFEFNDGLADTMDTIIGAPVPDNQTAVPGDGADLVNPDLVNLVATPPAAQRYSYIFDGNAQNIDHVLINDDVIASTTAQRIEHPRINADFPDVERGNTASVARLGDHDPVVAYLGLPASADLAITNADSPDPVITGANLVYTITVTNNGPDAAASASLSDTLPVGTTFVSLAASAGWTCTTPAVGAGGNVDCNHPSFAVGTAVFTLTVALDPGFAAGPIVTNTASVVSTTPDADGSNNSATATTTVATSADLSLTKIDSADPVLAGTNLDYTITLANSGPSNAVGVSLDDPLPPGTSFVSLVSPAGWTCTTPAVGAGGTVNCSAVSVPAGSAVFTLTVAVGPDVVGGTVLNNTATAASATPDPNPGNDSASATTTVGAAADLALTVADAPDPVAPGSNLSYTITATNSGPGNAASVSLGGTLPVGTTFVSLAPPGGWTCTTPAIGAGGAIGCTLLSLAPGSAVFTLVVAVDPAVAPGTVLTEAIAVSAATTDPNPGNEAATATTTVGSGSADLSLTMLDAPDPVTAGQNLSYTLSAANAGPANATDAALSDTLPVGTTFVSLTAPAGWTCTTPAVGATGTVSCTNASMVTGNAAFTLVVAVDPAATSGTVLSNAASLLASTTDPVPGNNNATATTTVVGLAADLSVTITDAPDPVTAGDNLSYSIGAANAGPDAALDVTLSDALPAGTTFVSLTSPAGWTCSTPAVGATGTVTCTNPSMATGNAMFTLVVAVDSATISGTVLGNTASLLASTTDPVPGNNSATATTTVDGLAADLSVTITDAPDPVTAGDNLSYSIGVANAGPDAALDATLSDALPAGTTFVSLSAPAGWTCTTPAVGATGTVECTLASMVTGNAAFALVVAVDAATPSGTLLSNIVSLISTTSDPTAGNNSATATTTVNAPAADVSVALADAPDPVLAGGNLTYTINLSNAGPAAASNVVLADILPAGTSFVSLTSPVGFTCTTPAVGAAGTVTCTIASLPVGSGVFTLVVQVDAAVTPGTVISDTATVSTTSSDPNAANNSATTTTTVAAPAAASVSATKTFSGNAQAGSAITYTITLLNNGTGAQGDNLGSEFTDVLPASVVLVSASATAGTAVATTASNTVTWDGSIAAGASVTITINATIGANAVSGTQITNQGSISFDADANGSNESTASTDDPGTAAPGDGTTFAVLPAGTPLVTPVLVPTTSTSINLLLAMMIGLLAMAGLRRRAA